jgi:hypothetical protein
MGRNKASTCNTEFLAEGVGGFIQTVDKEFGSPELLVRRIVVEFVVRFLRKEWP